jgi:uncharacterized membrane protein YeiB
VVIPLQQSPDTRVSSTAPSQRIAGYDLARALAILGMVLVHFSLVMSFGRMREGWLAHVVEFLDGRAAATFVVLAGVGLTLRSRRAVATDDPEALRAVRATIIRRGVFLLVAGYLNLAVWSGDILRVYGVSLLLAAWLLQARNLTLWAVALAFVAAFLVLFATLDFSKNWDWETLEYHHLWTPSGAARNLFYDGFRSVFPWTGLLVFGMWLGRRDLRDPAVRTRALLAGVGLVVAVELLSGAAVHFVTSRPEGMEREEAVYLFGTTSMPPLPLFLLSAAGTAVFVIAASVGVAERFPLSLAVRALVATGQLAFTWYVGHIFLGLGAVIAFGLTEDRPLAVGVGTGIAFFVLAAVASLLWRRWFRYGPLEWVMRRVAG